MAIGITPPLAAKSSYSITFGTAVTKILRLILIGAKRFHHPEGVQGNPF